MSRTLRNTIEDLRLLDAARTRENLSDALCAALGGYGICWSAATMFPANTTQYTADTRGPLLDRWPRDWLAEYVRQDYFRIDPVFRRAAGPYRVSRWRDAFAAGCSKDQIGIMEGARECGMGDGFTFLLPMPDGARAAISLAGEQIDCGDDALGRIALAANYAVARAICLSNAPEEPPTLTPRERDVLRWTCEGKTEWEIGEILGISEHTADKHLRALRNKLKAVSKTHLVARAFRLGLL